MAEGEADPVTGWPDNDRVKSRVRKDAAFALRRRGFWLEGARALFNLLGVHRSGVILLLLFGGFQQALLSAEAPGVVVAHVPAEPKSGQAVVVTVEGKNIAGAKELTLQYQVVEPGDYIALADAAFTNRWVSLPMHDEGRDGDTAKGHGVFSARVPAPVQKHRRLVRYRISDGNRMLAPDTKDAQPNFAYYVYDGVPAWRGAINPASADPASSTVKTFSATLMNSVQVYQFIAKKSSVENTTWFQPTSARDDARRHEYRYTGTLVANGRVYDHVRFRARGGEWRHAMGKNMWKLDFPREHHLQAYDNYGLPYQSAWEKLNLGACIQQATTHRRGEHGLYEAVTYRLFNLAGVPAPHTHYVHLRIVDDAMEENPQSQYDGDFWGLYLATEEIDGHFLKEHELPDGNIYKWDFGSPKLEHQAKGAATDGSDVRSLVAAYQRKQPDEWWRQTVDLPRYFSYRSILECVHHYDIAMGKNYFYYFDSAAKRWNVLPWDVDLTWKNTMYGTGQEPFWVAGVLRQPQFNIEFQNRLREIRDLLFNPEQMDRLIDEFAAVISDPAGGASFVEADRAKWDFHPILASRWVDPVKGRQGQFYSQSPTADFHGMVRLMKDYVRLRGAWCDASLLTDQKIPPTPVVAADGELNFNRPLMKFRAALPPDSAPAASIEWRMAEVTLDPVTKPPLPRSYEIEARWQAVGKLAMEVPTRMLNPGGTYRVRARAKDADGRCGHWSAPVEFKLKK